MSLQKNRFLSYKSYSRYYKKIEPIFKKPRVRAYTMLILSFFTMSFFGVFAIKPTLKTIAGLKKKINDGQLVNEALEQKIINLSQVKEEYKKIENDLPLISKALPSEPKFSFFLKDLEALAQEAGVTISGVKLGTIDLIQDDLQSPIKISSSLSIKGDYLSCKKFLEKLLDHSRIYLVDRFEISPDSKEGVIIINLSVSVDAHYLKTAYVQ